VTFDADVPRARERQPRRLVLAGVATVLVAGSSALAVQRADSAVTPPVAASTAASAQGAAASHAFSVRTAAGSTVAVPDKPTLLFFMTSEGCGDCLEEAAVLDELTQRWQGQVAVVGVEMVPGTPREYLDAFSDVLSGLSFPLAVDDGALVQRFDVQTLDTTIVLDRKGREVYRDVVPSTEAELLAAVARAGVTA
jgi:thiol-disulfide isomerase/thioredoxin